MRLIVDANVFIAAFMKDALTRELLLDERLDLATPEYGLIETRGILKQPKALVLERGLQKRPIRSMLMSAARE